MAKVLLLSLLAVGLLSSLHAPVGCHTFGPVDDLPDAEYSKDRGAIAEQRPVDDDDFLGDGLTTDVDKWDDEFYDLDEIKEEDNDILDDIDGDPLVYDVTEQPDHQPHLLSRRKRAVPLILRGIQIAARAAAAAGRAAAHTGRAAARAAGRGVARGGVSAPRRRRGKFGWLRRRRGPQNQGNRQPPSRSPSSSSVSSSSSAGSAVARTSRRISLSNILRGATRGRQTTAGSRVTRQYHKQGDYNAAVRDFDSLNPTNVRNFQSGRISGRTGQLGTGHRITVRDGSGHGNSRPTLEIQSTTQRPGGQTMYRKVRYESPEAWRRGDFGRPGGWDSSDLSLSSGSDTAGA